MQTCSASATCEAVADPAQDGSSCGSDMVCNAGACVGVGTVCGNGTVETGEQCDLGGGNGAGTGCETNCQFSCALLSSSCDDGDACNGVEACSMVMVSGQVVQKCVAGTPEADGTSCGTGKICVSAACVDASCGDTVTTAPEECDDGNATPGDGCDSCRFSCVSTDASRNCAPSDPCQGQGTCNDATHTCTPGTALADNTPCGTGGYCKQGVCTQPMCGNGVVELGESCDHGALNGTAGDGCKTDCTWVCTLANQCPAAPPCQTASCTSSHTCTTVADSSQNGQSCGTGMACSNGSCITACGDGIVQSGEQCDDGALNGTTGDGCKTNCTWVCVTATDCPAAPACQRPTCTTSHTCQNVADSTQNGTSCGTNLVCSSGACVTPSAVCGNGTVETGEQCDLGLNNGPGTGCESNCLYSCTILPNSCDDGNPCNGSEMCTTVTVMGKTGQKCVAGTPLADGASCGTGRICRSQQCTTSTCGDLFIDPLRGETCEPPNTTTCDSSCHTIVCGDGVRAGSEQCDDHNTTNLDGCNSGCKFEQDHRVNALIMQFGTDTFCTANAMGGAIVGSYSRNQLQTAINTSVSDGSITINFYFMGLDDLTGTNDSSLILGLIGGVPVAGTNYSGTNDLDWWYTTDASAIDGMRLPRQQLQGAIAAKLLTTQPAEMIFKVSFVGVFVTMDMFASRMKAGIGATSTPLASAGTTPGHLASENLDPALVSFARMGSTTSYAELCGNTTAASLANTLVPSALVGCTRCSQCYTTSNTLLDVYISGCNNLILGPQVAKTQPDTARNPSDKYAFTANAMKVVTSCTKNNQPALMSDCLANAGYSSFYKLTTDRVIAK